MGKQINFYMDSIDEALFIDIVLRKGKMYDQLGNNTPTKIRALPDKISEPGGFMVYLYENNYLMNKYGSLDGEINNIDIFKDPVIEFSRTIIRTSSKEISRGRLWLEMRYFDEEDKPLTKDESINNWYKELSKWIKKHLPRREIVEKNGTFKEYISQSLIELVENGYKLL